MTIIIHRFLIAPAIVCSLTARASAPATAPVAPAPPVVATAPTPATGDAPKMEKGKFVTAHAVDNRIWFAAIPGGLVGAAAVAGATSSAPISHDVICVYVGPSGDRWELPPAKPPCHDKNVREVPVPAPDSGGSGEPPLK